MRTDTCTSGYIQVLAEYSSTSSAPERRYVWGHDLISQTLAINAPPATFYYGLDGQGSVRILFDSTTSATVTDTYDYDAYGSLLAQSPTGSSATPNHYRYTGQQWDEDLGMYSQRARYYQPGIGRFWTMDTDEGDNKDPVSLHKYLYGGDDPVNNTDPTGNDFDLGGMLSVMDISGVLFAQISTGTSGAKKAAKKVLKQPVAQYTISHGLSDPEMDQARHEMAALYEDTERFTKFVEFVGAGAQAYHSLEIAIEEAAKAVFDLKPGKAAEFAHDVTVRAHGNFAGWNLYTRIAFKKLEPGLLWDSWADDLLTGRCTGHRITQITRWTVTERFTIRSGTQCLTLRRQ